MFKTFLHNLNDVQTGPILWTETAVRHGRALIDITMIVTALKDRSDRCSETLGCRTASG